MIGLSDLKPGDIIKRRGGRTFFVVEVSADHMMIVETIELREPLVDWTLVSHAADREERRS